MATTAKFPKIICRVKALYAFSSTEKSSLSFEKGELIEVLSQLDSGWWDGWCKGNRGWFPSNYVKIVQANPGSVQDMHQNDKNIKNNKAFTNQSTTTTTDVSDIDTDVYADNEEDDDSDDDSEEEARTINLIRNINMGQHPTSNLPTTPQQNRHSHQRKKNSYIHNNSAQTTTHHLHKIIQQQDEEQESSLPEGWTLQIADDGLTKFYFNQHTGGLRWNHPSILDSDDENENSSNDEYSTSSLPPPPINTHRYSTESSSTQLENFDDYSDFGKQKAKKITSSQLPESPISSAEHVNVRGFYMFCILRIID
jgi:hypothetical protein